MRPEELRPETKRNLDGVTIHPKQTNDELIDRLADAVYDDEELSDNERFMIKESESNIKEGRIRSMREIMKDMGDDASLLFLDE
ncbi:MAG: hypothetical protein JXA44_11780 [Methanospirillaceae archaeon]|nr:hypothetical protein [Methanospirillaceae archaeon]